MGSDVRNFALGVLAFVFCLCWGLFGAIAYAPHNTAASGVDAVMWPDRRFQMITDSKEAVGFAAEAECSFIIVPMGETPTIPQATQQTRPIGQEIKPYWTARVTLEPEIFYEVWEGPDVCPVYLHSGETTFDSISWLVYGWGKFFLLGLFFFAVWAAIALVVLWVSD